MKTLFILRHAKAAHGSESSADFDRPLNSIGLEEAALMGAAIYKNKIQPAVVLSSPAKRAAQTADLIKERGRIAAKIEYDERIYEASPQTLLRVLCGQPDARESVMLVGHNPGLENLIRILTGELRPMPTAALAKIILTGEKWSEAASGGRLEFIKTPSTENRN